MPLLPGLSPVAGKPLTATFDAGRLSSDGGLIVLREIAARLGLAAAITRPLCDARDPARTRHSYAEMALARMLMIAAGYEDWMTSTRCAPTRPSRSPSAAHPRPAPT